jgi:ERCC4-type nuclease
MSCVIDTRENQEAITDLFMKDTKLADRVELFTFKKLDLGDYLLTREDGYTILIERKTVADCCRSIFDKSSGNGSFKSKLMRMSTHADERGLLIEGDYQFDANGMLYGRWGDGVQSLLPYSIFAKFLYHRAQEGIVVHRTRTLQETLHLLLLIHDDKGASPALKVKDWSQFLMLLPGLSRDGVDKLKKKYVSPAQAFTQITNWPRLRLELEKW